MSTGMLEQRLEELERRLAAVETLLPFSTERGSQSSKSNWDSTVPTHTTVPPLSEFESERPLKTEPPTAQGSEDSWQQLFGWHRDDTLFREAARSGAEWRRKMNQIEE